MLQILKEYAYSGHSSSDTTWEPFFLDRSKYETNCKNVLLPFMPPGNKSTVYMTGFSTLLWGKTVPLEDVIKGYGINIEDARNVPTEKLDFHTTGFELYRMHSKPLTKDWNNHSEVSLFTDTMEIRIRELFPQTKRVMWTSGQVRGGSTIHRPVHSPHLYSQDLRALHEFNSRYPAQTKDSMMLLGAYDTEGEQLRKLIGVWMPINMRTPICDHPLAMASAATFQQEKIRNHEVHFEFWPFRDLHTLSGGIVYDESLKWYYYSFQKDDEVLLFTQFTKDHFFANPHTSFTNPNCDESFDSRMSIELRVGLFW